MPGKPSNKGKYILWGIIAVILLVGGGLSKLYVDWLWFQSINLGSVFTITFVSKLALGAAGFLFAFLFVWFNLNLTRRNARQKPNTPHQSDDGVIYLNQEPSTWQNLLNHRWTKWFFVAVAAILALIISGNMGSHWITVQQYLNQVPFGVKDPLFGHDLAFYFFNMPVYEMGYGYLLGLTILTIIAVGVVYLVTVTVELFFMEWENVTFATKHLGVLSALAMTIVAVGYRLHAYSILYSPTGVVFGAGYTDVHAKLLGYKVLAIIALLVAIAIIVNLALRRVRWILYSLGAWLLCAVVLNGLSPFIMQKLIVVPNEYNKEQPYIEHAIKYTRQAYNLDKINSRNFNIDYKLNASDLQKNQLTIKNIRLWDWQPLRTTYRQIQEIRPYYLFNDVDVDRYTINGEYRQVMLGARELDQTGLTPQAKTWLGLRMQYTHGYGVALSPVNELAQEGLPNLYVKDIPPRFTTDLKIDNPAIYYGEVNTNDYVIVKTKTKEFDYPMGTENVYTTYNANGGVRVGHFLNRLVFSYVFRDYKMLISNQINADSRVLINRNITTMMEKIAPFLIYDQDPYIVIADGKLYWMRDAYTVSNRYPYSEPFNEQGTNYIRNSVKVVVDAYTGQPTFYIADESDPIIKSMGGTFSKLFVPIEKMPAALQSHIRYPEDMFKVQTQMLTTYHMTNARVFYYKEDKWNIPQELFEDKKTEMQPYYTIMKLPDAQKEEYVLMLPFTPNTKQNMVAWLAARSDAEHYGKLQLYLFPKQELIFGPMQVESRINQDSEISQELNLWNQKGSRIFRGNLLVIPIENSILYIEPLYLQAQQSQLPELKRIIAVYGDKVVMEPTLNAALQGIFGQGGYTPPPTEVLPTAPGAPLPTETINSLIARAQQYYNQADAALRAGDFAGYGEAQAQLRTTLERLGALSQKTPVTQ